MKYLAILILLGCQARTTEAPKLKKEGKKCELINEHPRLWHCRTGKGYKCFIYERRVLEGVAGAMECK